MIQTKAYIVYLVSNDSKHFIYNINAKYHMFIMTSLMLLKPRVFSQTTMNIVKCSS